MSYSVQLLTHEEEKIPREISSLHCDLTVQLILFKCAVHNIMLRSYKINSNRYKYIYNKYNS